MLSQLIFLGILRYDPPPVSLGTPLSLPQNPPVHGSDFSWASISQMRHSRDPARKLNSTKPFPETNLFMLSLNSKSCGVYIIVFKISLAMLFYRFLKNNLYNPCFFSSVDYFLYGSGVSFCVLFLLLLSSLTLQSHSLHQTYVNTLSYAACSDSHC